MLSVLSYTKHVFAASYPVATIQHISLTMALVHQLWLSVIEVYKSSASQEEKQY